MAYLLRKPRVMCSFIPKSFAKLLHKSPTNTEEVGPIDELTDELLSKSHLKWEIQQQRLNNEKLANSRPNKHSSTLKNMKFLIDSVKNEITDSDIMLITVDFKKLNQIHIGHLVETACRDKNYEFIEKLIDQCIDNNKVMGENSMLILCECFSDFKDDNVLIKVIELCKRNNKNVCDEHCEFSHFIAKSLWKKGNSHGALVLLEESYIKANPSVRKSIRLIFNYLIEDTVDKKSEAVLVRLIRSAVLLHEQFNEPQVLVSIWKICFFSHFYSDQLIADQLFNDYSEVRTIVAKRRGLLCYNALCKNHVDIAYRLIQAFLKYNMKEECKLLLELLFEYQYEYKSQRACSEILKTALELDITLNDTYNHKLLNLLMGGASSITKPKKNVIPKFEFKF